MNVNRFVVAAVVAVCGSAAVGGRADAAYSYSTAVTITSGTGGGVISNNSAVGGISTYTLGDGTQLQFQNTSGGLFLVGSPLSPNVANVGLVPASATPTSFSVNYTNVITITNPAPGGPTGTFTVTGTLTVSNVALVNGQFSGTTSNVFTSPLSPTTIQVDGASLTLSVSGVTNVGYAPPTVGSPVTSAPAGSLSVNIASAAVPEPASLVMVGLGLAGLGGLRLRRRAA